MSKATLLCQMSLLMSILVGQVQAASVRVEPEIYQPASSVIGVPALKSQPVAMGLRTSQPIFPPMSMTLGEPGAAELLPLQQQSAGAGRNKAYQIGIRRDVPDLPPVEDWIWSTAQGGQAGHFTLTSLGALRLRTLVQLEQDLPAGAEIRIYVPGTDEVHGPYVQRDFQVFSGSDKPVMWSPTVEGDTLGIEVFVPDGVEPAAVRLTLPFVSHIAYDLKTGQLKATQSAFSSCDVSVACAPEAWQQTAKSVARYVFTSSSGGSYLCTGTLLADKDNGSQIPYFLTAAHCIDDKAEASSMNLFWFYRESTCGANDAVWKATYGGADLLSVHSEFDSALVRLKSSPPAGVLMSGWILDDFSTDQAVYGLHHGLGNPKQFSQGNFVGYASLVSVSGGYNVMSDPAGHFTQVAWTQGVTAGGSSGSGLWQELDGQHYLSGTLVGGSSSCAAPTSPDEYSRLNKFYPYISTWLEADGSPLHSVIDGSGQVHAFVDGVMLSRYMNGLRGSVLKAGVSNQSVELELLESRLDLLRYRADIDGDGVREASVDGVLVMRYLAGLEGSALISGVNMTGSPRKTATALKTYLDGLFN